MTRHLTDLPWADGYDELDSAALDSHLTEQLGTDVAVSCSGDRDDEPRLVISTTDEVDPGRIADLLTEWTPPPRQAHPLVELEGRIAALE